MSTYYRNRITDSHGHTGIVGIPVADGVSTAQQDALRTAIDGVSLGTMGDSYLTYKVAHQSGSDAKAVNDAAVKFNVWVVECEESAFGQTVKFSIPCADNSLGGGDVDLDISAGAGLALKNAVEAAGESKFGGTLTVTKVYFASA